MIIIYIIIYDNNIYMIIIIYDNDKKVTIIANAWH